MTFILYLKRIPFLLILENVFEFIFVLEWKMKILLLTLFVSSILLVNCNEKGDSTVIKKDYLALGDSIVQMTFDTLRKELMGAISREGVGGAIDYCQINAMSITSIFSGETISIRRAAEKYRNPTNIADRQETEAINRFKAQIENGDTLKSFIIKAGEKIHYFKPIVFLSACKPCHGTEGIDITEEIGSRIRSKYPNDKATNFVEGDIRCVWHITFRK